MIRLERIATPEDMPRSLLSFEKPDRFQIGLMGTSLMSNEFWVWAKPLAAHYSRAEVRELRQVLPFLRDIIAVGDLRAETAIDRPGDAKFARFLGFEFLANHGDRIEFIWRE